MCVNWSYYKYKGFAVLKKFFRLTIVLLAVFIYYSPAIADAPIGRIIAITHEAFAERQGKTVPLRLKDDVFLNDTLRTTNDGKVQVFFNDDSLMTLGADTVLSMVNYQEDGPPAFMAQLDQGLAKFVTGNITQKSPEAFKVRTPEIVIDVRGTAIVVERRSQITNVFTLISSNPQSVLADGLPIPLNHWASFSKGKRGTVQRITPEQRDFLTEGTTVSSWFTPQGVDQNMDRTFTSTGDYGVLPEQVRNTIASNGVQERPLRIPMPMPMPTPMTMVTLGGTFSDGLGYMTGNFSFDVDLATNSITNGHMISTSDEIYGFLEATGGTGSFSTEFAVDGVSGLYTNGSISTPLTGWFISGTEAGGGFLGDWMAFIEGGVVVNSGQITRPVEISPAP